MEVARTAEHFVTEMINRTRFVLRIMENVSGCEKTSSGVVRVT